MSVQSVNRAFAILEALARRPEGIGVTALARELGLKTPTAHNLLKTLMNLRYVRKEAETSLYRLGYACVSLGAAYLRGTELIDIARHHMEELARETDETIVLGVMEHGELAFVARAESRRMLTANPGRGWVKDGYGSVCGRVLLAFSNPSALEAYIRSHPVEETSAQDIRSISDLNRILGRVRREEFVFQWREGKAVAGMAAPIRDASGAVVAAVGLSMPTLRYKQNPKVKIESKLRDTARKISIGLGYQPENNARIKE